MDWGCRGTDGGVNKGQDEGRGRAGWPMSGKGVGGGYMASEGDGVELWDIDRERGDGWIARERGREKREGQGRKNDDNWAVKW